LQQGPPVLRDVWREEGLAGGAGGRRARRGWPARCWRWFGSVSPHLGDVEVLSWPLGSAR
jgi:hypothetical protein